MKSAVLELFQAAYPDGDTASFRQLWQWKLEDNPWRKRYAWVAVSDSEGRIVGFCAAYPSESTLAGSLVPSATLIDGLTHPRFRGLGVFTRICQFARADLFAEGVTVVYGFPNSAALHSHLRAGATQIPTWKRIVLSHIGGSRSSGPHLEPQSDFSDQSDAVWQSARAGDVVSLSRSQEFMRWRFLRKPNTRYQVWGLYQRERGTEGDRMVSFAVTRKGSWRGRNVLLLMDLVVTPRILRRDALRAIANDEATGSERIMLQLSPRPVGGGDGFPLSRLPLVIYMDPSTRLREPPTWNLSFADVDYL